MTMVNPSDEYGPILDEPIYQPVPASQHVGAPPRLKIQTKHLNLALLSRSHQRKLERHLRAGWTIVSSTKRTLVNSWDVVLQRTVSR